MIRLKPTKSAGEAITAAVKQLVHDGDAARDARDWPTAARLYGEAVRKDGALIHIWVQLGHAEKEAGNLPGAELAYRRAAALEPEDAEPHLHLGHLRKLAGDPDGAARFYLRAARNDPNHPDAILELHRSVEGAARLSRTELQELLRMDLDEEEPPRNAEVLSQQLGAARSTLDAMLTTLRSHAASAEAGADLAQAVSALAATSELIAKLDLEGDVREQAQTDVRPTIVFDASDLISYFRNARLPTGIQRVQIETISSALRGAQGRDTRICCFNEWRDDWFEIPRSRFLKLAKLSLEDGDGDDPQWATALNRLYLEIAVREPFEFPDGATVVNLGTSWWLQNYFLYIRHAKLKHNIRYVPFVHDLIPVLMPEHCVRELTQDFISWALGVFDHADFFLTNSNATKRDLIKVAKMLGRSLPEERVAVISLDADIRKSGGAPLAQEELSRWGLGREPFVLFVSTIESRKNHIAAFEAWSQLIRQHGERNVPRLVCVGNKGWLNDAVHSRLERDGQLSARVTMLAQLSDDELALLYRSCLFTVYPSLYEGWGLPVTESLCYGKVPLVSDASSLPEAGGPFAVYFQSGSVEHLVEGLNTLIFDERYRHGAETRIQSEFAPRTWDQVALQIETELGRLPDAPASEELNLPDVKLGQYHPIVRNRETHIWKGLGLGEIYRSGTGWWWPDDWGCWTKPQGGELSMRLAHGVGRLKAYFRMQGLPTTHARYEIVCASGEPLFRGKLQPGESRWISFEAQVQGDLRLSLRGFESESLEHTSGGLDHRCASIGLAGFFLCDPEDLKTRQDFMEALSFGDLGSISRYREVMVKPAGKLGRAARVGAV